MAFGNVRLRTFCIMSQRVAVCGKVNPLGEAEAKASLNRALSHRLQTRNPAIYPWAG